MCNFGTKNNPADSILEAYQNSIFFIPLEWIVFCFLHPWKPGKADYFKPFPKKRHAPIFPPHRQTWFLWFRRWILLCSVKSCLQNFAHGLLGGGFKPYLEKIPILTFIFFRWVVQPPTSLGLLKILDPQGLYTSQKKGILWCAILVVSCKYPPILPTARFSWNLEREVWRPGKSHPKRESTCRLPSWRALHSWTRRNGIFTRQVTHPKRVL